MREIKLLLYASGYAQITSRKEVILKSQEDCVELFSTRHKRADKLSAPQIFGGEMWEGTSSKQSRDVLSISLIGCDLDDVPEEVVAAAKEKLQAHDLFFVFYTTHSHPAKHRAALQAGRGSRVSGRFFLMPKEPIPRGHWFFVRRWVNETYFGGCLDSQTAAEGTHFLLPSSAPGEEEQHEFEARCGATLDTRSYMEEHCARILRPEPALYDTKKSEELSRDAVLSFLVERKGQGKRVKDGVRAGLRAARGEPYASEGKRDVALHGLALILGKAAPRATATSLGAPFREAIVAEHEDEDGPSYDEFLRKIERVQDDELQRAADAERQTRERVRQEEERRLNPSELEECVRRAGATNLDELTRSLIVQRHNTYYIFDGSRYVAASQPMAERVIEDLLPGRFSELGFSLFNPSTDDSPPRRKSLSQLVSEYGSYAHFRDGVRYDYSGRHRFDLVAHTLTLSEVKEPQQHIVPERVLAVEEWMRALAGDHYDDFADYGSQVPDTTRPLCGIVLVGEKGVGKTQFANGIAKVWNASPLDGQIVFDNFDEPLIGSPVVLCDEEMPTSGSGKPLSSRLRSFISRGEHLVNPKGEKRIVLVGYPRVVIALNSMNALRFGLRAHTAADMEAVADRLLILNVKAGAAHHFDYGEFILKKGLARHFLWLSQTRPRKPLRFGVQTGSYEAIAPLDAAVSAVIEWLVRYLISSVRRSDELIATTKSVPAFVSGGVVWANVSNIKADWSKFQDDPTPFRITLRILSDSVKAISSSDQSLQISYGGTQRENFWPIRTSLLQKHVEQLELCTPEFFRKLLRCPHEIAFRSKDYQISATQREERGRLLIELFGQRKDKSHAS